MNRNSFLKKSVLSGGILLTAPTILIGQKRDVISVEEISEFVGAAHNNFEKTKQIVEAKPLILNCASQLARGDFETAIGGASHMGLRGIADLLVSKGARLDIFNYTFLGYNDFVRKLITDYPNLLNAPGPHGFTLLHHAKAGGHSNMEEWLREKGLTETHFKGVFG
ncbi:MAG: hypothetical protein RIM99_19860 [Cyclobacteriaceae bacterium]